MAPVVPQALHSMPEIRIGLASVKIALESLRAFHHQLGPDPVLFDSLNGLCNSLRSELRLIIRMSLTRRGWRAG